MSESAKRFTFDHEPTFAELWDKCVYKLLYDSKKYKDDLEALFKDIGIDQGSSIVDVSAGGGFPALELVQAGYQITAIDGFGDQVDLFNAKARQLDLNAQCLKLTWNELPEHFSPESFDALLCRGNSFIYAGGGWNSLVEINPETALEEYRSVLQNFYNLLKSNGWIYIDKFKDGETTHHEKVGEIVVGDNDPEDLIFWTERFPKQKIRQASMIRKNEHGEKKTPNITYDLSAQELESLLEQVGFTEIKQIQLPSETHFDVWIAKK